MFANDLEYQPWFWGIWSQTNGPNSDRTLTHIMRPPAHTEQLNILPFASDCNALRIIIWAAGTRRNVPRQQHESSPQPMFIVQGETRTDPKTGPPLQLEAPIHTPNVPRAPMAAEPKLSSKKSDFTKFQLDWCILQYETWWVSTRSTQKNCSQIQAFLPALPSTNLRSWMCTFASIALMHSYLGAFQSGAARDVRTPSLYLATKTFYNTA